MALLILSSVSCVRRLSYEIFLRGHQACAALSAYAMWRHLMNKSTFPRICLYVLSCVFLFTACLDVAVSTYRNFSFRYGLCQAEVSAAGSATKISLRIPRHLHVRPGQYINLWLPRAGFRSLWQSHPFVIASWNIPDTGPMHIHVLAKPRYGFTRRLTRLCDSGMERHRRSHHLAIYGGPYGEDASLRQYGSVMMVAAGQGIAALLPHVQDLLDGFTKCEVVTRRIHLIWLLKDQGKSVLQWIFALTPYR